MSMTVITDMSQIASLSVRLRDVETAFRGELAESMDAVMDEGVKRAVRTVRVDTGRNQRSIKPGARFIPGGVHGWIGSDAPGAPEMELGRRPGRRMPPAGAMLGWMRRKGIPESREFVIRRAIGRRGIRADHNLQKTVEGLVPFARHEFSQVGPRVVRRVIKGQRP